MKKRTIALICIICMFAGVLTELASFTFSGNGIELSESIYFIGQLIWLFGVGMWLGLVAGEWLR
jgi:hypothetical protein